MKQFIHIRVKLCEDLVQFSFFEQYTSQMYSPSSAFGYANIVMINFQRTRLDYDKIKIDHIQFIYIFSYPTIVDDQ